MSHAQKGAKTTPSSLISNGLIGPKLPRSASYIMDDDGLSVPINVLDLFPAVRTTPLVTARGYLPISLCLSTLRN